MELRAAALSLLQAGLHDHCHTNSATVTATTQMLAKCELHFDPDASSRRSYFECAGFLLQMRGNDIMTRRTAPAYGDRYIAVLAPELCLLLQTPWSSKLAPMPGTCTEGLPSMEGAEVIDGILASAKSFWRISSGFRHCNLCDNSLKVMSRWN
ncbi:hypothetical protein BBO_01185 [Beauveria brongniartii RCEF 3172]|uniref:Uncharacterized protein n=1 Tax=Beauveria brongniartii RCEF 3172 TaxID=1081107 RepID=A0A162JZI6_9HYPO|nr:hypothetical protein BBO_01185 [Beauveria brongniartii RCEF 3172]